MSHIKYLSFILILLLGSCVSEKKLHYIQSEQDFKVYTNDSREKIKILPGDELYIRVSSLDDVAYNFFNTQVSANQINLNTELSVSLVSFTVNDSGYINYPIAGDIYVQDLIVEEVALKIQKVLSSYFNQPTVIVKKVNKMITVLGEVRAPGKYAYSEENISIFKGLGLAGDITIHGNKNDVTMLREENGKIIRWEFDLTSDSILNSPYYHLKSGDVIIVKSRRTALWSITSSSLSLALSVLTTLLVIIFR